MGDLNTLLLLIGKPYRELQQKISELNETIDQMALTNIYSTQAVQKTQYSQQLVVLSPKWIIF